MLIKRSRKTRSLIKDLRGIGSLASSRTESRSRSFGKGRGLEGNVESHIIVGYIRRCLSVINKGK